MLARLIGRLFFGLPALLAAVLQPALAAEQRFFLALLEGRLAEGAPTLQVSEGDDVVLELSSDRDLELHLHGYDIAFTVSAHSLLVWRIAALQAGRFPLAVHDDATADRVLLYLEVHPD